MTAFHHWFDLDNSQRASRITIGASISGIDEGDPLQRVYGRQFQGGIVKAEEIRSGDKSFFIAERTNEPNETIPPPPIYRD